MDKGILRFMAEAYLLLHAGIVAEAELAAESAASRGMKTAKTALRQERGGSTRHGKPSGGQVSEVRK
jgi:hypothetical protein